MGVSVAGQKTNPPLLKRRVFCTVSPSSAPSNKPSATPFIGQPNQNIIITNTYFNPVTVEIEMAQYDIDTLAIALYGNQTKSIEKWMSLY